MGYTRRSHGRRKQLKRSTNRRKRSGRRIRRTRRRKGGGWFTGCGVECERNKCNRKRKKAGKNDYVKGDWERVVEQQGQLGEGPASVCDYLEKRAGR